MLKQQYKDVPVFNPKSAQLSTSINDVQNENMNIKIQMIIYSQLMVVILIIHKMIITYIPMHQTARFPAWKMIKKNA